MNQNFLKQLALGALDKLAIQFTTDEKVVTTKNIVEYIYLGYSADKFSVSREEALDLYQNTIEKFIKVLICVQQNAETLSDEHRAAINEHVRSTIAFTLSNYIEDHEITINETATAVDRLVLFFTNITQPELITGLYNIGYNIFLAQPTKEQ